MSEERQIGLPPAKDAPAADVSRRAMNRARLVNLLGLVSPAANLGLLSVGPQARRWFGLGAGVVCAAAVGYSRWKHVEWISWAAVSVHYALVLVGLVSPLAVAKIGDAWAAFGTALGKVMAYPMFGAVYFLAVTPTALVMRAFGKDPLGTKKRAATYWTPHEPPSKDKYDRQF